MKFSIDGTACIVACPSYRRPHGVETLRYLPACRVYVAESEAAAYRNANPKADIWTVPDKVQGNLCRVRNWILDQNRGSIVCLIDDDLQYFGYWERKERQRLETPAAVQAFLTKYTRLAIELGTPLWGMNVNSDGQCYREYTPFSTVSYVGGPFMVHIKTPFRFDESLPLKEDYDFSLQVLNQVRCVLRVNKFYYITRQGGNTGGAKGQVGGCAVYRNLEAEREQLALLQKKWGDEIVRVDGLENGRNHLTKKEKRFDINPVIRVPIAGV